MILRMVLTLILAIGTLALSGGRKPNGSRNNGGAPADTIGDTLTDTGDVGGMDRGMPGDTMYGDTLDDTMHDYDTSNGMNDMNGPNGAGDTVTLQGTVLSVFPADSMVVLRSTAGITDTLYYTPATKMKREAGLREGQMVDASYVIQDGRKTATRILPANGTGSGYGKGKKGAGKDTSVPNGMIPGEMHEY